MRVEQFPSPGNKVSASEFLITSGGQAGNAAVAIARLGVKTSYIGALGGEDDEVANTIIKTFASENIDVSRAIRVPGARSSVSTIMIDATGEKMIATRRNQGLSEAVPADPEARGRRGRRGHARQSLQQYQPADLSGGKGARHSARARFRQADAGQRSAVAGLHACDLLGRRYPRKHRACRYPGARS